MQRGISTFITVRTDGDDALCESDTRLWLEELPYLFDNIRVVFGSSRIGTFASYKEIFSESISYSICQLDADDYIAPYALHIAHCNLLKQNKASFVYTQCLDIDHNGTPIGIGSRQRKLLDKEDLLRYFITFHLRLVKDRAYRQVEGYDPSFFLAGDYDLSLKLCEVGDALFIKRPLYMYRIHSGNTSLNKADKLTDESIRAIRSAFTRRGMDATHRLCISDDYSIDITRKGMEQPLNSLDEIFYIAPTD